MDRIWTVVYIERTGPSTEARHLCGDFYESFGGGVQDMHAPYDQEPAIKTIREQLRQEGKQLVAVLPGSHARLTYTCDYLDVSQV